MDNWLKIGLACAKSDFPLFSGFVYFSKYLAILDAFDTRFNHRLMVVMPSKNEKVNFGTSAQESAKRDFHLFIGFMYFSKRAGNFGRA